MPHRVKSPHPFLLLQTSMQSLFLHSLAFSPISQIYQEQVTPDSFAATPFDVLIIGGGTAGLTLANRLSATNTKVGVIDAGIYNTSGDPLLDVPFNPGAFIGDPTKTFYMDPAYDWSFFSVPQAHLDGRSIFYPRGKVLGGSSAINNLVWQRGAAYEYDNWGRLIDCDEWTFDELLPYFKKAENWTRPTNMLIDTLEPSPELAAAQGTSGHVQTSYNTFRTDIDVAFAEAFLNLGLPLSPNPDDGDSKFIAQAGSADSVDIQSGKRSYAAPAYYGPEVRSRDNLVVLEQAVVSRILWDETTLDTDAVRANAVEYIVNGTTYKVNVTREVILSAGSLKSPQVLELSGIGNPDVLEAAGVNVIVNSTGVGENMMDHLLLVTDFVVNDGVLTLDWLTNNETFLAEQRELFTSKGQGAFTYAGRLTAPIPMQDLASNGTAELQPLIDSLQADLDSRKSTPLHAAQHDLLKKMLDSGDIGFASPIALPRGGASGGPFDPNTNYVSLALYYMHEFSRGTVHVGSSDPEASPLIDPNFGDFQWDLDASRVGAQWLRKWAQTEPISEMISGPNFPPLNVTSDEDWDQFVKSTVGTISHPIGTAIMATRELGGVVDHRLKVYGTDNLRVVDASIIPLTVGAPIQQSVYAIAEKASDMIIADLNLSC
ncbi:alcohol oxidase [Dendrothele bispora CBS 962.96]|uniref:Alcohol oxidase n=1 Tax=Dendrothele bispora (strain CBS 962.96) TaxID=1314807 RepID=A0A4S8L3R4_DENBC|nr:alcohol oxidase [Dendrothele bispora CBS 962.96]